MGRYFLVIRYVISIICSFIILWGCDRSNAAPLKPLVVRKKIVVPQVKAAELDKKKTVRTAKDKEVTKPEKKSLAAKTPKTQLAKNKPSTAKPAKDKEELIAENVFSPEKKSVAAKTPKTQLVKDKPATAKPAKDKVTLIAKKISVSPAPKIESKPLEKKKPAIKPKSEISEIKQPVIAKPPATGDKLMADSSKIGKTPQSGGLPAFYDPTGKIDPFEPLFKEKAVTVAKKKRKRRIPRTPLERIDLSQLKLVGIIMASSGNRALVEEANGKGYVIKKGTYIGTSSGKVVKIKKEKVIVEEEFEDAFGKIEVRQREIKLPKPSGEL